MHITADNYRAFFAEGPIVLLNGVPVNECIEADDQAGYVIRYARDENGKLKIDGECLVAERIDGHVELRGKLQRWVQ